MAALWDRCPTIGQYGMRETHAVTCAELLADVRVVDGPMRCFPKGLTKMLSVGFEHLRCFIEHLRRM